MITKNVLAKGQIVIPKTIRDLLRIAVGDKVNIDINHGKIIISKQTEIEDTFQKICNKHAKKLSTEQIKKELEERFRMR